MDIRQLGFLGLIALIILLIVNIISSENKPFSKKLTVITTRRPFTKLEKYYNDIVDVVFDYACKNKIVGFKNDW